MAARKEILDFIMLERTTTPPKHEEIEKHLFRIIEIYNNREADYLTLQNDLFELVSSCKSYERMMKAKHTKYDFELVIMLLLQTAMDWQIFLPETEIRRYEEVRLNMIENLADYIRKKYSYNAKLHNSQSPPSAKLTTKEKQKSDKTTKPKGNPGKKPSPGFVTFFLPGVDAEKMLPILHEFMDGLKGKELAKHIVAITNVWIRQPEHKSVCKEFQAPESAYKEALDKHYCRNQYSGVRIKKKGKPFTEEDLEEIRKLIRKRYEQKTKETQE